VRWFLFALMLVHGLILTLGFLDAFGVAELAHVSRSVSKGLGVVWLLAGLAYVVAAISLVVASRSWWALALVAVVLSQAVIITAWSDAKFGTLANLIVLLGAVYGFASRGPLSLRAEYEGALAARAGAVSPSAPIHEADLEALPEPVRGFMTQAGVLGQPRAHHFAVQWRGRIRASADEPWMEFHAEQANFVDEPARFFMMDAVRGGLPVDVLHVFEDGAASMRARLLSLVPIVRASGPEMTRAETVTLLNDMVLFAPTALLRPEIEWQAVDERRARVRYTVGENSVGAELVVDENCEIVDFVSDDRLMATPAGDFVQRRWSTPMSVYREFGELRLPARGEARWYLGEGEQSYAYLEAEILDVQLDGPLAR
jgi:hypothetical protein